MVLINGEDVQYVSRGTISSHFGHGLRLNRYHCLGFNSFTLVKRKGHRFTRNSSHIRDFFLRKCSPQGFKSSHGPIYVPAEKHTWTGSEHQHPTLTHNNGAMLTYFKDNQLLVGQALRIFKEPGPNDMYLKWMRTWPEAPFIRHLSFGNSEVLLVNSLEAHKEVMQTKAYSFAKPAFFEKLMGEIVGKGVLFSVRDEHRLHRRILAGRSHNI